MKNICPVPVVCVRFNTVNHQPSQEERKAVVITYNQTNNQDKTLLQILYMFLVPQEKIAIAQKLY